MSESFYSNAAAVNTLANIKKSGRICHAYLITGARGVGKRTFARLFAKTMLCETGPLACGTCPACVKAEAGIHPDITVIHGKGTKNSIHIEAVRAVKGDAYILPNEGAYKIYIIEDAQDMSLSATNALLKLLEEPPEHAMLILTATAASELPETVVSRCVEIKLCSPSDGEVAELLQESGAAAAAASEAAALAGGDIGLAQKMLSGADDDCVFAAESAKQAALAIAGKSEYKMLAAFAGFGKDRKKAKEVLTVLCEIMRRALIIKCAGGESREPGQAALLAEAYGVPALLHISEVITQTVADIDKNANVALLLSCAVAQIKS